MVSAASDHSSGMYMSGDGASASEKAAISLLQPSTLSHYILYAGTNGIARHIESVKERFEKCSLGIWKEGIGQHNPSAFYPTQTCPHSPQAFRLRQETAPFRVSLLLCPGVSLPKITPKKF